MSNSCNPIKSCGQTSIPQTDNSQIECDEIHTSDCINLSKAYLSFQIQPGDKLTDLLDKFASRILSTVVTQGVLTFNPTSQPTTPTAGMVYSDSTTGKLRHYNGITNAWEDLS